EASTQALEKLPRGRGRASGLWGRLTSRPIVSTEACDKFVDNLIDRDVFSSRRESECHAMPEHGLCERDHIVDVWGEAAVEQRTGPRGHRQSLARAGPGPPGHELVYAPGRFVRLRTGGPDQFQYGVGNAIAGGNLADGTLGG